MSYDPKLKDYMIGQYTGYSGGSAWGAMGAQHYKPPGQTTPIRTPVVDPQRGTPPVSAPPVYQAPQHRKNWHDGRRSRKLILLEQLREESLRCHRLLWMP